MNKKKWIQVIVGILILCMGGYAIYGQATKDNTNYIEKELVKEEKKELINNKEIEKSPEHDRMIIFREGNNLDAIIKENPKLLIEFRAVWCPYCKELETRIPSILDENPDLMILQIDMDEHPEITQQFQITATPTLVYFENAKFVRGTSGALPNDVMKKWLETGKYE